MLKRLKALTISSIVRRFLIRNTFDTRISVLMSESLLTWSTGARATLVSTAPREVNLGDVKRPAWIRACPAGPILPATLELYLLSRLLMLDPLTPRLKAPRFVPGSGSSVTPSPSRSEKKISSAPPVDNGRKSELARELLTRVAAFAWKPHGRSTRKLKPSWCSRSSLAGPKNCVGRSLKADPDRKS